MILRATAVLFTLVLTWSMFAGCRQCTENNIEKKGESTVFEEIPFHISQDDFLKRATQTLSLAAPPEKSNVCRSQISMPYPVLENEEIRDRFAGNLRLTHCTVRSLSSTQTTTLLEIRGEFISDKLSRISYRIDASQRVNVLKTLTTRFGTGNDITLIEEVIIEDLPSKYRYWRDENEVWLLSAGEADTAVLVHQDLKSGRALSLPTPSTRKGNPVSLEDIGIGKLDLNAPLPSLDGIALPDSGVSETDLPDSKGNTEAQP